MLKLGTGYPVDVAPDHGNALMILRQPLDHFSGEDAELISKVAAHAEATSAFVTYLEALRDAGWSLRWHGHIYAQRGCRVSELPMLLDGEAPRGACVSWAVPNRQDYLVTIGGLVAGHAAPSETYPGAPLPAVIENQLTGAQHVVDSADQLRVQLADELISCAAWWYARPDQLSDYAAHELPGELERVGAEIRSGGEIPETINHDTGLTELFERSAPRTHLAVTAVSAIVFSGIAEALREIVDPLTPREGLGARYRREGAQLAAGLR
jgi:hypothetical protein